MQLSLFDAVEDSSKVSSTSHVEDTKIQAIQRFLHRPEDLEPVASVGTYTPNGRNTKYFRLQYRQGSKVKCIHIPGGNINSQLAQYRAKQLQQLIDRGAELAEILAAVQTYRSL